MPDQTSSATSIPPKPSKKRSKLALGLLAIGGILLVLFIVIQFIPVNRDDPPVITQINWDSQQTRDLAYQACMDCHSNETRWPVYSYVAPTAWLVSYDVQNARSKFNLSDYDPMTGKSTTQANQPSEGLAYKLGQFIAQMGQPGGHDDPTASMSSMLADHITGNEMPPSKYLLMHPSAKLTEAERQQLLDGMLKTLGLTMSE